MASPAPVTTAPNTPYAEFLAELDEIERHKWLISEREGRDVGFERALNEWAQNHRAEWREMRHSLLKTKA